MADGGCLFAWFAGPHEGHPETGITVMRAAGRPTPLAPDDRVPHWNPVLADGPDGSVWLFYKRGHRIDSWETWVTRSHDGGRTWESPAPLIAGDTTGGRGPTRQAPLPLGGLWLAPGSVESWDPARWDCFIDATHDGGGSWVRHPIPLEHRGLRGAGCIQPTLVPGRRTRLVALARSTEGSVYRSATDDPADWPALQPTGLPNNNSGIAAVVLPDGRIWCAHNDASGDWGARSRLIVSSSEDDGLTWRPVTVLEEGAPGEADGSPAAASATGVVTDGAGEYSYPAMIVVGPEVWVTYSWQRRSIALVRLPHRGS
nr:sialidase family protein [Tessaracoccus coleopterorum]